MTCLLELHKRGLGGLVFDAVLISLPAAPTPAEWLKMRQVTSRRLVNAYSYVVSLHLPCRALSTDNEVHCSFLHLAPVAGPMIGFLLSWRVFIR